MPFPAILEESSTPFKNGNSRLWKELLANEMFGDAHSQYAKIVDVVQLVCRDLEDRCMTVESPLREAEANNAKLQRTIEDISQSNSILKEECEELKREIEEKQSELAANAHEVRCAKTEIEGCQRQWRNCMSAKETALAEYEKDRATWQETERKLLETIGIKEEILKNTHEQLAEARSTVRAVH
jgi:chromosome segregation ATPase